MLLTCDPGSLILVSYCMLHIVIQDNNIITNGNAVTENIQSFWHRVSEYLMVQNSSRRTLSECPVLTLNLQNSDLLCPNLFIPSPKTSEPWNFFSFLMRHFDLRLRQRRDRPRKQLRLLELGVLRVRKLGSLVRTMICRIQETFVFFVFLNTELLENYWFFKRFVRDHQSCSPHGQYTPK